jgi:phosphatidylinositol-3-phosphatase
MRHRLSIVAWLPFALTSTGAPPTCSRPVKVGNPSSQASAVSCSPDPTHCPSCDPCHLDGCLDPSTGSCSDPAAAEGTPCPGGMCQLGVCAEADGGSSGSGPLDAGSSDAGSSTGLPAFSAVWTIVMENHSATTILNDSTAVFIQQLVSTYSSAVNYSDIRQPSLPNYIEMICGCDSQNYTFDSSNESAVTLITSMGNNMFTNANIGSQLDAAGIPWRAYAQDSSGYVTNCESDDTPEYASRHFPFVYFQNIFGTGTTASAYCIDHARVFGNFTVGTGDFYTDLARGTYRYQWITPDVIYDMHDGTVADGDNFLSYVVPAIQNTAAYQAGGVIFITWDDGDVDDNPLFIAVSNYSRPGYESAIAYSHTNFFATVQDIFGLPRLGDAQRVPNMSDLFQ